MAVEEVDRGGMLGILNPKVICASLRVRLLTQFPATKPEMEV